MQHLLLMILLILFEDREGSLLEVEFNETKCDQTLVPLIPVIEGLMKYLPSSRITASQALRLLGAKNSGVEKGRLESVREGGLGVGLCYEKWGFFEKMEKQWVNRCYKLTPYMPKCASKSTTI
jgi:hypothetical protein